MHVSHGLYSPRRSPPHVPSSPPLVTCNCRALLGTQLSQPKLASVSTRVRHEALFISDEEPAHRIRDGRISGQDFFHLGLRCSQSVNNHPSFLPSSTAFAARSAAGGGSWSSPGKQQPDGKRVIVDAMRPPGPVLPAPVGVSLSFPAGLLKGARPVGLQEQGHQCGGCNRRRQQHRRMGGHRRASALCLSIDMLSVCAGGTFAMGPPLGSVHICRVVCPGPE